MLQGGEFNKGEFIASCPILSSFLKEGSFRKGDNFPPFAVEDKTRNQIIERIGGYPADADTLTVLQMWDKAERRLATNLPPPHKQILIERLLEIGYEAGSNLVFVLTDVLSKLNLDQLLNTHKQIFIHPKKLEDLNPDQRFAYYIMAIGHVLNRGGEVPAGTPAPPSIIPGPSENLDPFRDLIEGLDL